MKKKAECEQAIRHLVTKWAREVGFSRDSDDQPSYDDFRNWAHSNNYGHYLEFRSTMDAYEDAERWFDEELGQTWRN